MTDGAGDTDLSVANELIQFANDKLTAGLHPMDVAANLRNAAANFSAFALMHQGGNEISTEMIVDEFRQMLEFYDDRHRGRARPATPLERLVDQAKIDD